MSARQLKVSALMNRSAHSPLWNASWAIDCYVDEIGRATLRSESCRNYTSARTFDVWNCIAPSQTGGSGGAGLRRLPDSAKGVGH